jgi:putative FmdB family regulatory protein
MPLYEYRCSSCQQTFERLAKTSADVVACPSCQSQDVERLLSTFAVGASRAAESLPGPCGRCGDPRGPGACHMSD